MVFLFRHYRLFRLVYGFVQVGEGLATIFTLGFVDIEWTMELSGKYIEWKFR